MLNKDQLINNLIFQGVLDAPGLKEAFRAVDRSDFILPEDKDSAYGNFPLPIGGGQTISQPFTVAFMLKILDVRPGLRVLDIGSGSAWTTALLARLVGPSGEVLGLE